MRKGIKLAPLIEGGFQEAGNRGGTEHVSGIVGLGYAACLASREMKDNERRIRALRDTLQAQILKKMSGVKVNGHPQDRLYNTLHLCIEGVLSETMVINLDFKNICVSNITILDFFEGALQIIFSVKVKIRTDNRTENEIT